MIGRVIQNYRIISLLGKGGMGTVYKALDFKLDRYVAIKVINPKEVKSSNFLERFKREAKNQAKLTHPNIVSVYGFVEAHDVLGIVMEYIDGKTVEDYIKENGRLSIEDSILVIKQVLEGIIFAHEEGFIHRDLKPSNLIIDSKGIVKIMDFGISKSINDSFSITKTGSKVGTVFYMSPEQIRGYEPTIQSDIYSLAVTLYEMIYGSPPFNFSNEYDILDAHLNLLPVPLSQILSDFPQHIDEIILKGMQKSSLNNYSSAVEFLIDLNSIDLHVIHRQELSQNQKRSSLNLSQQKQSVPLKKKAFNFFLFIVFGALLLFSIKLVTDFFIGEKRKADRQKNILDTEAKHQQSFEWNKNDLGTFENLNSICIADVKNLFICGDNGLLLKSTNLGKSWNRIEYKTHSNLYSIKYFNNKLLAVGENGTILYSADLGLTWEKIKFTHNESIFDIETVDQINYLMPTAQGRIFKSTILNDIHISTRQLSTNIIYDIKFVNNKRAFAVGWNGLILYTNDDGINWYQFAKLTDEYLKSIDFNDEKLGIIVGGNGTIFRSEDEGKSWDQIFVDTNSSLTKVKILNKNEVIIISGKGEVLKSVDSGKSFIVSPSGVFTGLTDIILFNHNKLFITGANGTLLNK